MSVETDDCGTAVGVDFQIEPKLQRPLLLPPLPDCDQTANSFRSSYSSAAADVAVVASIGAIKLLRSLEKKKTDGTVPLEPLAYLNRWPSRRRKRLILDDGGGDPGADCSCRPF